LCGLHPSRLIKAITDATPKSEQVNLMGINLSMPFYKQP
jgi:hypothetical protein